MDSVRTTNRNLRDDGGLYERCPGQSWDDILDEDALTHPVPDFLREESLRDLGSDPIPADSYTSREWFELERTRMWPHVWQFAARAEDLPGPGDFVVYENAGKSFILSRQDDGSIRAYYNVCLHRGRKLKTEGGNAKTFVCPF
ncbi:MAG: Rieske 2Fe-2S domain-containing protein, partial [Pseudomonadota bacterium]